MAEASLHITGSCIIQENAIYRNGQQVLNVPDADMNTFLLSAYQQLELNYPKFYKMDNLSKLGWLASEVLLKDKLLLQIYQPEGVGLLLSNRNSSLDADVKYWASVHDFASPSLFVYTLPNIVTGEICIRNGFKGENAFYITEGFNADFIHKQVAYLMNNDILQVCICGWVDVIGEEYKAALFLVEKDKEGAVFTDEALERAFK
ncbi:hypothetical protein [Mucilaginibacter sp. KACC 22063]|uniref:hypothetical protein n=1 Tax=Mucilaginibacter sp. KACC 22063 TaxID=3025666 RepID=UPI002366EE4D|nr:hypothetical protein [Mucilaginibacter sp. KACC 22063]WDF55020.1 hypothetical protein PQ461_18995 [Mucilaginibacter sp. KACC 22063]